MSYYFEKLPFRTHYVVILTTFYYVLGQKRGRKFVYMKKM